MCWCIPSLPPCDQGTGHVTQMDTWELPNKGEGLAVKQKVGKMKFRLNIEL